MEYLYDEGGTAIAAVADGFVWSPSSRFLGWFALSNEPTFVVDQDGSYFGEVLGDRLCRRTSAPYVTSPGRRSEPLDPHISWGYPPSATRTMLPPQYEDIPRDLLR